MPPVSHHGLRFERRALPEGAEGVRVWVPHPCLDLGFYKDLVEGKMHQGEGDSMGCTAQSLELISQGWQPTSPPQGDQRRRRTAERPWGRSSLWAAVSPSAQQFRWEFVN